MNIGELGRLNKIAEDSWYGKGANATMVRYSIQIFSRYILRGSILELRPAEGIGTALLSRNYSDVTAVEGSQQFCEVLRKKFPNVQVVNSLFEDYQPDCQFDNIILGHVLEHVQNPEEILEKAKGWLSDKGRIMCAVPNSHSIHRQAAVLMGLLQKEDELNEMDKHHGHRRVYNPESFQNDFLSAGLKIEVFGGYWLKPLSNKQIEESWSEDMLNSFMVLGEKYPDIAAEIYVIAGK